MNIKNSKTKSEALSELENLNIQINYVHDTAVREAQSTGDSAKRIFIQRRQEIIKEVALLEKKKLELRRNWAKLLSNAIRSNKSVSTIQDCVDRTPIDAEVLMLFSQIERDKAPLDQKYINDLFEAKRAEIEDEIKAKVLRDLKEKRTLGYSLRAKKAHQTGRLADIRRRVINIYEAYAKKAIQTGAKDFRSKSSFQLEMQKLFSEHITDPNTVGRWIKESSLKVPHWKRRADGKS